MATVCAAGSASHYVGSDTEMASCAEPGSTRYVTATCVTGFAGTAGVDTAIRLCTEPASHQFVTSACDHGDEMTSVGSDTVFSDCSEPAEGRAVVTPCTSGSSLLIGTDTRIQTSCDPTEPAIGEYLFSLCIPGA